jgi:hypothetical protein
VTLGQRSGRVYRPTLNAAIILKAVTSTIPARTDIARDLADAAFLLSLVADPIATAESLTKSDRKGLASISAMLDVDQPAWRPLGTQRAHLGRTALDFMIGTKNIT